MTTHDWLEAEHSEQDPLAEAAFAALIADLPADEPDDVAMDAFVARTMAVVAARAARRRRVVLATRAAMVVGAVGGAVAGALVAGPLLAPHAADGVMAGARGLVWLSAQVGTGLRVWNFFSHLGGAVAAVMATPQAASVLIGLSLTGALALAGMARLLDGNAAQEEA